MDVKKYEMWYNNIISKAKSENRDRSKGYFESHHIIPKSMGGSNDHENLVLLTAREHYIAHMLLVRFVPNNVKYKMVAALARFFKKVSNNSHSYDLYKRTMSKFSSGEYNTSYGKIWAHNIETQEIIYVDKTEFDSYDKSLFMKGLPFQRGGYKDYVWIFNGNHRKAVPPEKLDDYLSNGWEIGRFVEQKEGHYDKMAKARHTKEKDLAHKLTLSGRIAVRKDNTTIRVKKDQVQSYLDDGYILHKGSGKKMITNVGIPCTIDGVTYVSVAEASRVLSLDYQLILRRIKSKKFPTYFR